VSNNQLDACCSSEYLRLKLQETFVDFAVLIVEEAVPVEEGVRDERLAMDPSALYCRSCVVGGENKRKNKKKLGEERTTRQIKWQRWRI